jgi:MFS family permease
MATRAVPSTASFAPQQQVQPEERSALTKVMYFGIIQIVGNVAGLILPFYLFGPLFLSTTPFNLGNSSTPQQISAALTPLFQTVSLLIATGLGLGLVGSLVLAFSLRELKKVDRSRFNTPWILMLILVVGTVVAALGLIPLFTSLTNLLANIPPTSTTGTPSAAFFSAVGTLLTFLLIAGIGGILSLIGLIGGEILGLWRVGSRYNETTIKIGAIFEIIPFLGFVAPILILVGASQVRGRLPAN